MESYKIRVPHGDPSNFNGWYTFVRGAMISRRMALRILIFGPHRAKIDAVQSPDQHHWGF